MKMPAQLTPESLAQAFLELIKDRYPNADKVLKLARPLGIDGDITLQIIVFSQLRDMVRQVSRDYMFRSVQHRDDVYSALIAALEDLEDRLQEMEDKTAREELEQAKRADNKPKKQVAS